MIRFQLVSLAGSKYDDEAYEVMVPTRGGPISIFEDHMPLISAAQAGVLSVRKQPNDSDSQLENFAINGGVIHVDGKTVRFIADDITTPDEISEQEAAAAVKRAEDMVASAGDLKDLEEAQHLLRHSSAKLHVARLKRRHHT